MMATAEPRLFFSRRRMLNRLSFTPTNVYNLLDPDTCQGVPAAVTTLLHLKGMGLAAETVHGGWYITDAGVAAMAANGVIHAEDAGR